MAWPTIAKPSLETPTKVKDNSLKSPVVNGQSISRKAYTRQLRTWKLTWNAIIDSQLATLLAWYATCGGGSASFAWTDEFTNSYTVQFEGDIDHHSVSGDKSYVSLSLVEV